jgi:molecular chaperone GrpE
VAAPTAPEVTAAQVAEARLAEAQLAEAGAELEASRARLARDAVREREAEKLRLAGEVLPVLDDLDRSIAAARSDEAVKPALIEGFDLVRSRLERVLQGYGLERIASVGERFDPAVHDAIGVVQVDNPRDEGVVIDELERGYRAGGRVLRPARVRVGAA